MTASPARKHRRQLEKEIRRDKLKMANEALRRAEKHFTNGVCALRDTETTKLREELDALQARQIAFAHASEAADKLHARADDVVAEARKQMRAASEAVKTCMQAVHDERDLDPDDPEFEYHFDLDEGTLIQKIRDPKVVSL